MKHEEIRSTVVESQAPKFALVMSGEIVVARMFFLIKGCTATLS